MISKNHIDRAIYHVSKDIVCRRYNPLAGIVLTIVGAALLWANYHVSYFDERELLAQWNLLLSSCLLLTGLTMICYRLFGDSSAPVERATGERLYRSEYFFETSELPRIREAVETGDFSLIGKLPRSYQPAAEVVCYRTESGSILAAQLLQRHEPQCDVLVFREGNYTF